MLLCLFKTHKLIPATECLAPDELNASLHMSFFIAPLYIAEPPAELEPTGQISKSNRGMLFCTADKFGYSHSHIVVNHHARSTTNFFKKVAMRLHESQRILMTKEPSITPIAMAEGKKEAQEVAYAMNYQFKKYKIKSTAYISAVNTKGVVKLKS